MILRCVAIDDEPLARECIASYTDEVDFLQLVGTGSNPLELSSLLKEQEVDLIFLDIQMPKMNGIDFLKMTTDPPLVIITTAYPSYAIEGFQLDVMDYLVKPITFSRFFQAATKAREYLQLVRQSSDSNLNASPVADDHFFIKSDHKYEKIYFADILFIQALQNYITIYTEKGKFITLLYLKSVEEKLSSYGFLRVHKSFVVPLSRIETIENNEIVIGKHRIPLSRNYHDAVMEKVVLGKLWRKKE